MLNSFDKYLMDCERIDRTAAKLEAHYRKESVCEPGCTHSLQEQYCSLHSSQAQARTIGRLGMNSDGGCF
jgi:hypothetical protein